MAFRTDLARKRTALLSIAEFLRLDDPTNERCGGHGNDHPVDVHVVPPSLECGPSPLVPHRRQCVGATETGNFVAVLIHPRMLRRHGNISACTSLRSITLSSRSIAKGALAIECHWPMLKYPYRAREAI